MTKTVRRLGLLAGFFAAALGLHGEPRWYISNAAGMTLEAAYSRAALRGAYALCIDQAAPSAIPERLREFFNPAYQVELRVLYENGEESRRQWLFKDQAGQVRLTAVFNAALPSENAGEGEAAEKEEGEEDAPDLSGFIELYNEENQITEERRIDSDGASRIIACFYRNRTLVRTETRVTKAASEEVEATDEALCTDYYRYSRSASLRAIERVYHRSEEEGERVWLPFPHMILDAARQTGFVRPEAPVSSEFFQDVLASGGDTALYTTDDRGRILTETRRNEDGEIIGELRNTWTGNRLTGVHWVSGEDDRITEYEYNEEGDRILERNINKGTLERVVRTEGSQEIEELYMDNQVILRAVWENGRKISEERVREGRR
ncbi:MAG: hypothetical protein LBH70_05145 [Spirochaetaceae bacterium]|nr:hypothetical protein [Spirochaetaceae bacterium]